MWIPSACNAAENNDSATTAARSQRRPNRSVFLQQGVEKAIMPGVRENLPLDVPDLCDSRKLEKPRIRMRVKECRQLQLCFLREDRAGRVEQFTTSRQRAPQSAEQNVLLSSEVGSVCGPSQPFDVWMAAHDTRGRARCIEQDTIEWYAVPPGIEDARVRMQQLDRRQLQPCERLRYQWQTLSIAIDRGQLDVAILSDVCGFAARSRTRVEHALAGG